MEKFGIGQPVPRTEDPRLLTGRGNYLDDITLPRQAFAVVVRSPHPHAEIAKLDTAAAKAAPGVLEVLTWADYEADGLGIPDTNPKEKKRDGSPMYEPPNRPLAKDRVRMVGDYVALVVAETAAEARDAAELFEVEYRPLPTVSTPLDAIADGAAKVWDDCDRNICYVHLVGDKDKADAAFEGAAHVVHCKLPVNRTAHMTMEPRGAIGEYEPKSEQWTLYSGVHNSWEIRRVLSGRIFKVPEHRFRVRSGDMGGSFGLRGGLYHEHILVMWAARRLERPVKWVAERSEGFISDHQSRDIYWEGEMALDADGTIRGVRATSIATVGAYLASRGTLPPIANLGTMAGTYDIPAMHLDVTAVFTNTTPQCPFRGNGRPEAAYVIERLVDLAADELGMDPAELRRRNSIAPDRLPYKTALTFTYDCGEFARNLDDALKMAAYDGFEARRAEAARRGKLRGIGMSNTIERAAAPSLESCEIRVHQGGTVTVSVGTSQQGQGHETIYKQIVCEKLGIDPDDIRVIEGDTDTLSVGGGTGGSRSATMGGGAVLGASDKIVDKAKSIAAHMLEAAVEDIELADGKFSVAGTDRSVGFGDVVRAAHTPGQLPPGFEPGLAAVQGFKTEVLNFPNGCHVCELEIDEETGEIDIVSYKVVDDVGTVLNPLTLKGQIHGGVVHGVGQALYEHIIYDRDSGQILTGSLMDFCVPRADNVSSIEVESNPVPTATNPLGCKGAGEAGTVGAVPAVMNAVVDALSPLGVRHVDMPATSQRIWQTIRDAKKAQAA